MSEEIVTTDAGAVSPESAPAAAESASTVTPETITDAGAVSPTQQPAAADGVQQTVEDQTTGQEGGGVAAEGKQHNKPLEQRVQELVAAKTQEIEARLTAQLKESTQAPEKLDFIPDLDFDKINDHFKDVVGQIEQAELDGDFLKALELRDQLNETRNAIKQNEQRKAQHMQSLEAKQQTEQQTAQINSQIAEASKLVQREHKIPDDVWKAGEEFFMNTRRSNPLIDAQYREKVMLQGPVAAMLWAKDYVTENMGKKESELITQKEAAKETLPAGKTAGGTVPDAVGARLAELKQRAASGNPSDLAAYSQAKREASQ